MDGVSSDMEVSALRQVPDRLRRQMRSVVTHHPSASRHHLPARGHGTKCNPLLQRFPLRQRQGHAQKSREAVELGLELQAVEGLVESHSSALGPELLRIGHAIFVGSGEYQTFLETMGAYDSYATGPRDPPPPAPRSVRR